MPEVSLGSLLHSVRNQAEKGRRLVPASKVPDLVQRRLDKFWDDPRAADFRRDQEAQMRYLLEFTERAPEVPELAYAYAAYAMRRAYLRWHPNAITHQRVEGIEWLTTKRDQQRGAVMSFTHHAQFDGMFSSLARKGADLHVVMSPLVMGFKPASYLKQHRRVVNRHTRPIEATVGTEGIAAHLTRGDIVAIAPDVPGQTEVTFLGRRCRGSFGTARLATMTNSPVVLLTAERDDDGSPYLRLHEPIEPSDFAEPRELLDEILRRHGEAVLAWPEAVEDPTSRFAPLEADDADP